MKVPEPPPASDHDADGRYHAYKTDAWGVRWEHRIFGVWGHPVEQPLADLDALDAYEPPTVAAVPTGDELEAARGRVAEHRETWFHLDGAGQLFEVMHAMRRFEDVLMDLAELGVRTVWPQLPLYDQKELHARCRDLCLAVEIHPDRGEVMQRGTPSEIRDYVMRAVDNLETTGGGSWLYLEVDPGFPWENVEALFGAAMELRR